MRQRSRFPILRNSLFVFIVLQTIMLCPQIFASSVTIDADGNTPYKSFEQFLQALQNKAVDPDTVFFGGSNIHSYSMSYYVSDTSAGEITFIGNSTNPDSFPVIILSGTDYYFFFQGTNIRFERLAFTGAGAFASGDGAHKKVFSNCVFSKFSTPFLKIAGQYNSSFRFENCLFFGNTSNDGLFSFTFWGGQPVINFVNCTFDSNKTVFGAYPEGYLTFANIKNSIFSGSASYFSSANLKAKTTNSLTSEASGYTNSCLYSAKPAYTVTTRTKASDFKLPDSSRAKGIADTTGAPLADIAGRIRGITNEKGDAGCWTIALGGGAEIVSDPRDTIVAAGSVVKFTVTVKGTEKIHYSWYVDGVAVSGNDTSVYTFTCAAINNGNKISCKVVNGMGKDSSTAAILTVRTIPSVTLNAAEITASAGDTVTISATATGGGVKYQWFKDTTKLNSDTLAALTLKVIQKSDSGKYVCIASNIAGSDTAAAVLHVAGAEPHISLEPKDITVIEGGTAVFSTASSGRNLSYAWYKENSNTLLGSATSLTLSNIKITDAGKYFCIVKNDSGIDTTRLAMLTVIQSELKNPLAISALWNGDETVNLKISGFSLLSPDSVSLVSIWCVSGGGTQLRDTILAAAFPVVGDTVAKKYSNVLFSGERMSISWMVQVQGIQGKLSNIVQDSVTVGFSRTANNAKLSVEGFGKDSITLSWSIPALDQIDSIRIWYGTDTIGQLPVVHGDFMKFVAIKAGNDSLITLKGLNAETLYNIAIQVQKGGNLWSFITASGKKSVTTSGSSNLGNTITVTDAGFDTLTNLINVSWKVDTAGRIASKMIAGITWGVGSFTLARPSKVMIPAIQNKYQLDLGENLFFDTTYCLSLWLGLVNGADTVWNEPTEFSKDSVKIPSPVFQKIVYFEKNKNVAYAFGREVVLQAGGGYDDPPYTDTVNVFRPSALQLADGLVPVSLGIVFLRSYPTDSISVSLRYKPDSIPAGFTDTDIRMYEFDSKKGVWNYVDNIVVDTVAKMIKKSVRSLNQISNPLMLMIDRKEPLVTIPPDTNTAISVGNVIETTLGLSDNIGKLRVTISGWGVAGNPDTIMDSLTDLKILQVTIPENKIFKDFGLKAVISVSDGRFTKYIDISRSVNDSLTVSSFPMKWTPVSTNLVLNKPRVPDVFKSFCKGEWNYDSLYFRIFTWGDSLAKPGACGWIEYSNKPDIQEMFTLIPGRILWVKTREPITLSGNLGYTVSLKEPYKNIVLKAKNWTDIALPFKFNTFISDIIDSSAGTDSQLHQQLKESLLFHQWEDTSGNKNYKTMSYHVPIIPDKSKPDTFLDCGSQYAVYNLLDKDVVLKFPSIPLNSSQYIKQDAFIAKRKVSPQWGVSINAQTAGEKLQSIYFGYSERLNKVFVPNGPSFSKIGMAFLDDNKRYTGAVVTNEKPGNGYTIPVVFFNGMEEDRAISYSLNKVALFPDNFRVVLADPQTGIVESGSEISVGSKMSAYRVLVIGDEGFIAKQMVQLKPVSFALVKMYPNPCRNLMQIRYTIPYSGIRRMDIKIFDQLGRTVWSKKVEHGLLPGSVNTITWNPKASSIVSGTYIVRLTAINENGSVHGIKQQKVMYIP